MTAKGLTGTAYQLYQEPIDDLNRDLAEQEPHSYDSEITRLANRDMAEEALQRELQRQGSDLRFWDLHQDDQQWFLYALEFSRSYPEAVRRFLARRDDEKHVDAHMADFKARLEKGR